jgi:diaminopimelate decarboxylase
MHQLLRPAMYDAFHFIWPTRVSPDLVPPLRVEHPDMVGLQTVDIVGPICETGDTLAKARRLPPVQRGDRLAIFTAGAYGMAMASQYNAMPRPAEVLVRGKDATRIRRRETYADLVDAERETAAV